MMLEGPGFVVAIVLVCTAGWLINNWIRAKHGYPLEDEWGGLLGIKPIKTAIANPAADAENARLKAENRELHNKLDAMQDRLVVLEKIVTDRGYSLAQEIEALRDTRARDDAGVPLGLAGRERA
jgi:hypothetical protein